MSSLKHPKAALLFAAGLGSRMAPLTDTLPKPLIRVGDRTLLDHALAVIEDAGISNIIVNIHYRADQIEHHLAQRNVMFSDERAELLETGGGLRKAMDLLQGDPVITLNTDAVWTGPNPVYTLRDLWDPDRMEALLLLVPPDRATGHSGKGDFEIDGSGRITPGPGAIYTGLQILRTDRLCEYPDGPFSIWAIWNDMLARGTVFGALHPGGWCDVGRPDSIPLAETLLRGAPSP